MQFLASNIVAAVQTTFLTLRRYQWALDDLHPSARVPGPGWRLCLFARTVLTGCLCCFFMLTNAAAAAALPQDDSLAVLIDSAIDQQNASNGVTVAPQADPETLLRRTTLDLAGRIPTAKERDWYLALPEQTRQSQLVDRLMQLPDFDFHLRNSLDELLLPDRPNDGEFRDYLLTAVRERRPWSRMFREMLLAAPAEGPDKGAAQFVKTRVRELDDLTNDTAVLFFGVNISCAKCHDHPLVADWKQDHYYGMQAFFHRTFSSKKNLVLEKPYGGVKFRTTGGEDRDAALMFLTGTIVPDATPSLSDDEKKAVEEQIRKLEREDEAPTLTVSFSPRQALIDAALADQQQQYLARNIVNRTWARLLGTGIVDPPDQMHSGNPASHPELLQALGADLVQHEYDLRRLIRSLVLTRAYGRSSVWTSDLPVPAAQTFALAIARPLTPRQLATSLLVATRSPDDWPAVADTAAQPEQWLQKRTDLENQANGWMREFEQPSRDFQIAVDEALFFSNSDRVQNDLLRDGGDRLVGRLKVAESSQQIATLLWQTVCSRTPTADETQAVVDWFSRSPERRVNDLQSLAWAVLAGTEFRFNH